MAVGHLERDSCAHRVADERHALNADEPSECLNGVGQVGNSVPSVRCTQRIALATAGQVNRPGPQARPSQASHRTLPHPPGAGPAVNQQNVGAGTFDTIVNGMIVKLYGGH